MDYIEEFIEDNIKIIVITFIVLFAVLALYFIFREKKTYEIYWTEKTTKTTNVTAYKVTYNYENKSFSNVATGTVSIGTETEKDKDGNEHTYKIIDGNSFK